MVERLICNQDVVGSIPIASSTLLSSSVVERKTVNLVVVGSNPAWGATQMIDKIWDALWKIGEKIWEAKQKPEHKGKPLKQFWKDWRADVKKQQEEYKKL